MGKEQAQSSEKKLLLVDAGMLPDVFVKVLEAKQRLLSGEASSASEAARMAGVSRSAFYKYKDGVFAYNTGDILTVHAVLQDRPGVLSSVLSAFGDAGANILTVNQNIPSGDTATISVSARTDCLTKPVEDFLASLARVPGVKRLI